MKQNKWTAKITVLKREGREVNCSQDKHEWRVRFFQPCQVSEKKWSGEAARSKSRLRGAKGGEDKVSKKMKG